MIVVSVKHQKYRRIEIIFFGINNFACHSKRQCFICFRLFLGHLSYKWFLLIGGSCFGPLFKTGRHQTATGCSYHTWSHTSHEVSFIHQMYLLSEKATHVRSIIIDWITFWQPSLVIVCCDLWTWFRRLYETVD